MQSPTLQGHGTALSARQGRRLVLMGGAAMPARVLTEFLKLAMPRNGGKTQVLICPLASQMEESASHWQELFNHAGQELALEVDCQIVDFFKSPHDKWQHLAEAQTKAKSGHGMAQLCTADALFFTGGDQRLVLEVLKGTDFEATMRARWHEGELLVGGSSAGLQVCSEVALTGDFFGLHADEEASGNP
jgi:cyanophycinase-like exopeptidase